LNLTLSSPAAPGDSLAGLVERVTFFNEENGFCILKVRVRGHADVIAVIGSAPAVSPGEWIDARGHWVQDREFGRQFKADILHVTPPDSAEGIERYLASGLVKGVGPTYARKLVARFGTGIFDVIENASARLQEIDGIGPKRRQRIKQAWNEQKAVRKIMVFLHGHGVSTARAVRIHKTYGEEAIEIVRADPYRLARDIRGIGFKTADQIAQRLGLSLDAPARIDAGLQHVLLQATDNGHCALPLDVLRDEATRLLVVDGALVLGGIERSLGARNLIRERIGESDLLFLPNLRHAENAIAHRLLRSAQARPPYPDIDAATALTAVEARTGQSLAPSQREAVLAALRHRVLVITGGPGVGKTTILRTLLALLTSRQVRCQLAAPTGRAARRMAEATGLPAQTIHRLLEVNPGTGGFLRKEDNQLATDLLVIDEASMVDVPLLHSVLRALPEPAALLLVGDVDQLPSVGPGSVLRDLIDSGSIPVVRLLEVFRQAAGSRIITNAHRINHGLLPEPHSGPDLTDFYFIEREDPGAITTTLLEVVRNRIPTRFKLDPIRDVQILTPQNRGSLGVRELNNVLQDALNPTAEGVPWIEKFGIRFRRGDKVLQTRNNYDKDVFNGDVGWITALDELEQELTIDFDGRPVVYDFGELDEVVPAYAMTVHKSQGSEFPAIVIPLAVQQYILLQRNLLYTAITRGRKLVVVIGQSRALRIAVQNDQRESRWGGLAHRLQTSL
jgi:exodeoxyribonuclease V alpha subunit